MLVFIGFIGNIEYAGDHCCTHLSMGFELCILLILPHFNVSVHLFRYDALCLKLVGLEDLGFLLFRKISVQLLSLLVLLFTKVAVLNDYILAL